ncbi:immunoglobulin domain-containing protein [Parachlamydia sp. AcF125]|uniref:immunoglobulin domain-containing protein n=1 Tax=Parachlamydia sp. AcF125 TaxID=2795736 RepID=UPI001BC9E334|nr:immunoglobulin domain-containing protein [Parachlamydia sp. AcF125]MBS4167464.1 hypothetical protein [Parachlamydia sp. AcF125]
MRSKSGLHPINLKIGFSVWTPVLEKFNPKTEVRAALNALESELKLARIVAENNGMIKEGDSILLTCKVDGQIKIQLQRQ